MTIFSTDVVAKDIKFCVLDLDKRGGSYTISNMNHPYYSCDPDEDFVIDKNYKIKGYYEYLISKISMPTGTMSVSSLVTLPNEITIQQKIDLDVRKYRNKMRQELCDQGKIRIGCEKKIVAKVEETKSKVTKSKKVKAKAKVTKVAKNYNTNSYKGKSFQGKNGVVYEGWSKQKFCKQEYAAGWDSAWCRKRSSYFQNGIEVNEWKGKPGRFAIFKNVTSPINTNAWDNKSFGNGTFHAIAYGWTDVQKIIDQLENKESNPKTINFTIKDKKEQCEVIGFKPQTEKFADCVLRLVELDVKKQQSNVALSNNNSTNNAIAKQLEIQNKQLERQRYDEGTKFLFDLSRQLSQPKSSSWSTCSYIDFGHGMGKVKCN